MKILGKKDDENFPNCCQEIFNSSHTFNTSRNHKREEDTPGLRIMTLMLGNLKIKGKKLLL